jgi:hypothetical protein
MVDGDGGGRTALNTLYSEKLLNMSYGIELSFAPFIFTILPSSI